MLMPKRVKRRKQFRGSMKGKALRGNKITNGEYGLVAMEPCWIRSNQIEAARIAMTRYIKRGGKVWIKIFPDKPVTTKPAETRMGSGKGTLEYWVAVVKPGRMDDVKLTLLLCDVCDEEFDSIQSIDPQRNTIPVNVVKEGGIISGGEVPAWNEAEFATVHKKYRVITRAFADLCNPEAGYEPETAQNSIELKKGEYHDYHIYLNATRYTVEPGHSLALVITTEDPINCLIHKTYSVEIENASVTAEVPMTEAVENRVMTRK